MKVSISNYRFLRLSALAALTLSDTDPRCLISLWFQGVFSPLYCSLIANVRSNSLCFQFTHSHHTNYQVRAVLEEIMEKLPEDFNMAELLGKAEERTPYQVVALQECERMNLLTHEIRRSLRELSLGLKVRRLQIRRIIIRLIFIISFNL